jgi:SAM-dependent methyltransferase
MSYLNDLAIKYNTDKQDSAHGYIKHYYNHLQHLQAAPITLLEIGVHKGASLQMWADFFSNGTIYGIDDGSSGDLKREYPFHNNIKFREGLQNDGKFLERLILEQPKFDVIIDDGSHYSQDIIFTFKKLFDAIKPGGYYIIEDLHCSYPPYSVSGLAPRFNRDNFTAVQFISSLVDYLHQNDSHFESISIYKGISFIRRAF